MTTENSVEIDAASNAICPSSGSLDEDIEMKTRVDALWEHMNKGVSSKNLMSILNKSRPNGNRTSSEISNCWIMYLGLTLEGTGSSGVQNDISDGDKKIDALWERMNEGVPRRKLKSVGSKPSSTVTKTSQATSNNWMNNLAKKKESVEPNAPQENGILPQKRPTAMIDDSNDEAKRLAAAALSAVREAATATPGRGKVGITEVRDFAGQDIEVTKFVDADSKEASEKGKGPAPSAVDAILEQIKKKPKLSVLDKTKKDWGEFKEEQRLDEELDAYKKSSNQYLDKVSFLQRADYREFERERDARLALQVRRRPDMREEP